MSTPADTPSLRVNGRDCPLPTPPTLPALLESLALDPRSVVVELNRAALLRHEIDSRTLAPGDRLEILKITAGG